MSLALAKRPPAPAPAPAPSATLVALRTAIEVLAPAPGNETYGANVIRELITTATKIAGKKAEPSLYDLALARNMAKTTKNKKLITLIDAQIEKMCAEFEPKKEPTKKRSRSSLRA